MVKITKEEYPTAKEMMSTGKWIHLGLFRKKLLGVHYYAKKKNNEKFDLYYMYCVSELGFIVLGLLRLVLIPLRYLFNLISKGLGDETFNEITSEIRESSEALLHRDSTGHSFGAYRNLDSIEDCRKMMDRHIERVK